LLDVVGRGGSEALQHVEDGRALEGRATRRGRLKVAWLAADRAA
jgi:hypothetical protein